MRHPTIRLTATLASVKHALVFGAAALLFAAFAPRDGKTQGIGASATRTTSAASTDPNALQKQMQALERRVLELEKEALETADDAAESDAAAAILERRLSEDEAAIKKLTERLAAAEKQAGNDDKKDATTSKTDDAGDDSKPTTITAPFMVVDGDGKPILRVGEEDGSFSRGLYVYNDKGASVAHMGARADGLGRAYVSRPNATPTAVLSAQPAGGALLLGNGSEFVVELNKQALSFRSDAKATLAQFGTKNREKGYLELNSPAGDKMVEAGMLNNNKGYVLANPYTPSVTPQGDPSVLRGGGK